MVPNCYPTGTSDTPRKHQMIKTLEDSNLRINEGFEQHDFGVTDLKGRKVGATVSSQVKTFVAVPADSHSWNSTPPGTYFCWMGNATRAGEWFGAGQSWNYCKTEAERFAQVEKYLKSAKARALKIFA